MSVKTNLLSVQIGCGLKAREFWINFDKSPTLLLKKVPLLRRFLELPSWSKIARYGDIVSGLPIDDATCQRVYADQVFEHLTLEGFRIALGRVHKMLAPDGVLRFFIPHLREMVDEYLVNQDPHASHLFMFRLGMGARKEQKGLEGLLRKCFGNSRHQWLWDESSLHEELSAAGFTDIRVAKYGDSGDEMFDLIELPAPWDFSLGMQATKSCHGRKTNRAIPLPD